MTLGLGVAAQQFAWRDSNGDPMPDTEARKSSGGFGGWLLTTSDQDWEAKWNTPEHVTPSFTEAETVREGETVYTLIFMVNPLPNSSGDVDVRCDIRVTRPNGTLSLDRSDLSCLSGELAANPNNIQLSPNVLAFLGEDGDPAGTWIMDVTLRDVPRDVALVLRASFELLSDG